MSRGLRAVAWGSSRSGVCSGVMTRGHKSLSVAFGSPNIQINWKRKGLKLTSLPVRELQEHVKRESLGFVFKPVSWVSKETTGFSRASCLPSSVELGVFLATLSLDFWSFFSDICYLWISFLKFRTTISNLNPDLCSKILHYAWIPSWHLSRFIVIYLYDVMTTWITYYTINFKAWDYVPIAYDIIFSPSTEQVQNINLLSKWIKY